MPRKIIGLDIGDDFAAAVLVERGLRSHRVLACASAPIADPDRPEPALESLARAMSPGADACHAAIPPHVAAFRHVRLPFGDSRRIRQAIAFELEPMLPFPIDEVLVDFQRVGHAADGTLLAAAVEQTWISSYLGMLSAHGLEPSLLDIRGMPLLSCLLRRGDAPDMGLILDAGTRRATLICYAAREVLLIRSLPVGEGAAAAPPAPAFGEAEGGLQDHGADSGLSPLSREVLNTLRAVRAQAGKDFRPEAAFLSGSLTRRPDAMEVLSRRLGIPCRPAQVLDGPGLAMDKGAQDAWDPVTMTHALALAVRDRGEGKGFNFRRGEFALKTPRFVLRKEVRTAALFLLLAALLFSLDTGLEYRHLTKSCRSLDDRIHRVFRDTFPDATRVVAPLDQMRVKMAELKRSPHSAQGPVQAGGVRVLDVLKDIWERIPDSLDVRLSRMTLDGETVRMSGETDTFKTVEAMKARLENTGQIRSTTISSASMDAAGGRVLFEMTLERRTSRSRP